MPDFETGPTAIKAGLEAAGRTIDKTIQIAQLFKKQVESSDASLDEKKEAIRRSMFVVGPPAWEVLRKTPQTLPCDSCATHGTSWIDAGHDDVNVRTGKPMFNEANFKAVQGSFCSNKPLEGAEGLNTETTKASEDSKMAFRIASKGRELGSLAVGSVGGGVGFVLVDQGVKHIALSGNAKDALHLGIGAAITILGVGFGKKWLGQIGAAYTAVPVSRLTQRNILGGIPVGYASPTGALTIAGATPGYANGRGVHVLPTPAKTY